MDQAALVLAPPNNIPQPKYQFNQRVRCTSQQRHPGIVGVVRGFHYLDTTVAACEGLDDSCGWIYSVRRDDNDPLFWCSALVQLDEEDLEPLP